MFDNFNTMVISETGARRFLAKKTLSGKPFLLNIFGLPRDREIDVMVTGDLQ